ncbi:MAG TPA: ABC transporter substrate-binding protein [Gammaproteobacteria bacterium]|nr:ABC transporter substrate-binding protein [Gammaproteobacteria bacterium]
MLKKFFLCLPLILSQPALAQETAAAKPDSDPQALVASVTEKILQTIKDNRARLGDAEFVAQKIEELIVPHIDQIAMSKLALGKHWRTATPEQRNQFVEEFKNLLIRTYKTSLVNYNDQTVDMLPFRPSAEQDRAVVSSSIKRAGGPPIRINYSMRYKPEDGWKVYDIVIEGVSLVTNYRSTFDREIMTGGMDKLLESMRNRNLQPQASGAGDKPAATASKPAGAAE